MKVRLLIVSFFIVFLSFIKKSNCQEIILDHLICVVSDIDSANSYYSKNGFTIKNGYLHKNGLLNSHIKFTNNSSLELMSVKGNPSDEIARNYMELLESGEGGVFIAISGIKTQEIVKKLTNFEIEFDLVNSKAWNYILFPKNSGLEHFFFIDYEQVTKDSNEILIHKNGSERFKQVVVEGNEDLITFLKGIGVQYSGKIKDLKYGFGDNFITKTGNIFIIPKAKSNYRPRIKSVSFENKESKECYRIIY